MKVVAYYRSKGLVVEERPMPRLEPDEVLVKVVNVGFCGSDHSMVESGSLKDGTVLGHEVSGFVEDTGRDVKDVEKGMRVIIRPTYCGKCRECLMGKPYLCQVNRRSIGIGDLDGAFAEYVKVFPDMLIPVPGEVDYVNAALAEVFATSLHGLKCSRASMGSALIVGGGAVGLALLEILKLYNFGPICLSEPFEHKRELAKKLGADAVFNPMEQDFHQEIAAFTGLKGFDTVFECSGANGAIQDAMGMVSVGGTVCILSMIMRDVTIVPITINFKELWLTAAYSNTHEENKICLEHMRKAELDGRPFVSDYVSLDELPRVYKERINTGQAIKVMIKIDG